MSLLGKRVVAWIPYGRHKTVEILLAYLQRDHDRGIVDELWLYMNTKSQGQVEDRVWARRAASARPWVKLIKRPEGVRTYEKVQMNTMYAYRYMTDENTIFIRFDDDIVYIHEDAVENLVADAASGPQLCSFPIIINNAIVSHYLQTHGVIPLEEPDWPEVGNHCMDPIGWADGGFAVQLHERLLEHIDAGTVDEMFLHTSIPLRPQQFSVSCFASRGAEYARLDPPGVLGLEEEKWHTSVRPREIGEDNTLVPNALVSHLTFLTQWRHFEPSAPGGHLLGEYRRRATRLTERQLYGAD
jgi:hypothetical protein